MANEITFKLAIAADTKRKKSKDKLVAPQTSEAELERAVPADGQRQLAKDTSMAAMVMGWDRAIQKHAYENRIPEAELRRVLDQALEYNDKADPSGRIDELEDWKHEKTGRSSLASPRR